jgi:23S rRNA (uracil747-C5)-methyltransferase
VIQVSFGPSWQDAATMECHHFDAGRCRSCVLLETPYSRQLADKQRAVEALLPFPDLAWDEPVASPQSGFRNKAKMVVAGTNAQPTLGILGPEGSGVDLRDCGLHTPGLQAALPLLADFVARAELTPYDVRHRRGELKYLLVTESPDGELMLRFVLRSQESVARIRKHLPALLAELPRLRVVSVNLQPEHKAILEGERELPLTDQETLTMRVNGLDLRLRPQSFFQTNTAMAAALYRQASTWVDEVGPRSVWDLYCGVGGFALHVATEGRDVLGVEVSREAIRSAEATAVGVGAVGARFVAGDATTYAVNHPPPDLVIVNPPRRGIGAELSTWLEESGVRHVVYSSCNARSLAEDLAAMPSLRPTRGRLLDMFPNTAHYEVVVLLERARR